LLQLLQAVIKLKRDGEFYVHNIGRATMFVNGRPVLTGKRMHLTHCCLVEVRPLPVARSLHHLLTPFITHTYTRHQVRQIAFIFDINRSLHAKLKSGLASRVTTI
jgi:hypothetical protein